ncbi:MAG TPA: T9SS type A sorting domain-containing protein, partial [Bacteroidales bacterium]|nr:T9SS type A sorting domain-containing protein [Bacteroidales bacterium]
RIQGNEYWDQTQIHLNTSATSGYESSFDALKLMDGLVTPQIFSMIPGDENLSINTLPDLAGSPVIELGFKPGTVTEFTLNATGLESFAPGTEFYLEDLVANKVQNLKNTPVYTFTAGSGQPVHRFNLHFAPVGTPENQLTAGIRIYSSDKTAYVNVEGDMNGTIVVYNLLGSEIARKAIQPHSINKINLDEPTGFYLVKVESEKVTSASKVFIR